MITPRDKTTRINKLLSELGVCSRREADRLIEIGSVTINNVVAILGDKATTRDTIKVDGIKINTTDNKKKIYLAFNKPVGIVCTTDTQRERNNIIDYINYKERIFPVGRLDKLSEGLIFMTNDGDIVNKILRSRNNHEKEYEVVVNKPITKDFISKMSKGVPILDTVTKQCIVKQTHKNRFKIILTQGLNRQIRRMSEYLGYKVLKLKRMRIMNVILDIPPGKHRNLTNKEIAKIKDLVKGSKKTS